MKHDVIVPSAGESVTEVYIGEWRKKTGDLVLWRDRPANWGAK